MVLDLKNPEGLEIFYSLVDQADAVIDNFRPGVMARLGIDHESLKKRKPSIITASVTGFGETGPERARPAFDLVFQAFSGHVDITGHPDAPPARVGIPLADLAGGIFTCISVLGALVGRGLHGDGHHADVAMLDSLVSMLTYDSRWVSQRQRRSEPARKAHAHMVPWQAFEVKDGFVVWRYAMRSSGETCVMPWIGGSEGRPPHHQQCARVANRQFLVERWKRSSSPDQG